MAEILLKGVSKSYPGGAAVLDGLDLAVEDGGFVVLAGPQGSGVSTVLRLISGHENPDSGEVWIGGQVVNALPVKARDVGMVFPNYALYPHMTIQKNLAFPLELRKLPRGETEEKVRATARALGIEKLLEKRPKDLGEQQRQLVALGRAMVQEPEVFLLDDPLLGLDAKAAARMQEELLAQHKRLKATFIYGTHDATEAMKLGGRLVVLDEGKIQQQGSPEEVYQRPANLFVAGFFGTPQMNLVEGTLREGTEGYRVETQSESLELPPGRATAGLKALVDGPVVLGVRPEDLHDDEAFIKEHPAWVLPMAMEVNELRMGQVYLYLNYAGRRLAARVAAENTAKANSSLKVGVDMAKAHLFGGEDARRLTR